MVIFNVFKDIAPTNRYNLPIVHCDKKDVDKIIAQLEEYGINVLNVGKFVSTHLKELSGSRFITIELENFIDRYIDEHAKIIEKDKPEMVAIYNLGILLEPDLKLNAAAILKSLAKRNVVIVIWEHSFTPPLKLHWEHDQSKYYLDFSGLNLAKVYHYEI